LIFPGGGIDPNESAIEAAKRETKEESGYIATAVRIAHPATIQLWPDEQRGKWAEGFHGGFTHWVTASVSDEPDPSLKPEMTFEWKKIDEVIQELNKELLNDSAWSEDIKARIEVLKSHADLHKDVKLSAYSNILHLIPTFTTL
jgi:8-oxo-dGTP pyrophosphatase MutT (NUDIX family)